MNLNDYKDLYVCITFEEANILSWYARGLELIDFIQSIDKLRLNTKDPYITGILDSLQNKLRNLTEAEFRQLCKDVEKNKLLYPGTYQLPYIESL